jgi:quinoprotein glucose dehydrogenase
MKLLFSCVAIVLSIALLIVLVPDRPPDARVRRGVPVSVPPVAAKLPVDYWAIEDAAARAALPKYQTIPAARSDELTPANHWPDAGEYDNWYRSHGNDANTRFSPLTQINRDNVKSLKPAWVYHSRDGKGNIECNPVAVDGVMYVPTVGKNIVAINAETGKEIWRFKPDGYFPAYRGLTYYKGDANISTRLLFCSGDGLWALDPQTGKPIASFGNAGKAHINECVVAPAVYKNVIVFPGYARDIFGIDLATGKPLWTFHTIPQPGEPYYETWDKPDQGANCWTGMALDASRGIAYITTGSPKPNFLGARHRGDNLYGNCVIAVDVINGKHLWHFQEIHHDTWDLDIPAPPVLVTVNHEGQQVDAVAAVTKIGNTLLLDRVTGKLLFPFRQRRAPVSTLPGEVTAPYQPDLELPEPFSRQEFKLEDVTDISPRARQSVFDQLQGATFGWFEPFTENKPLAMYGFLGGAEWTGASFDPATGLLYVTSNEFAWLPEVSHSNRPNVDETKLPATPGRVVYTTNCMRCHGPSREGVTVAPALLGLSHRLTEEKVLEQLKNPRGNVMPPFPQLTEDQKRALLAYLFDRDRKDENIAAAQRPNYYDHGYPKLLDYEGHPGVKPPWGWLNAIDLNTGKIAWRTVLGEYPELAKRGIHGTGSMNMGGAIVTAGGLVFCGGTADIKIRAFDKSSGAELWSAPLPLGGFAPPSTYAVHGKQYVVISASGGGKMETPEGDAYAAFTLPETGQ